MLATTNDTVTCSDAPIATTIIAVACGRAWHAATSALARSAGMHLFATPSLPTQGDIPNHSQQGPSLVHKFNQRLGHSPAKAAGCRCHSTKLPPVVCHASCPSLPTIRAMASAQEASHSQHSNTEHTP